MSALRKLIRKFNNSKLFKRFNNKNVSTIIFTAKKRKKVLLPFAIGVLIILVPLVLFAIKSRAKVEADWSPAHISWGKRQRLTITNSSTDSLAGATGSSTAPTTTIAITVNTKNMVSLAYVKSDCSDLRIVYQPNTTTYTEITRYVYFSGGGTCATSEATKVYFRLQTALANTASSTDYYMYYDNPHSNIPTNTDTVFNIGSKPALLVCPFDGSTTCAAGEKPDTTTGAIRYSGSKSALELDGQNDYVSFADSTFSQMTKNFTYEVWVKVNKQPQSFADIMGIGWDIWADMYMNADGQFIGNARYTNWDSSYLASGVYAQVNVWHHLALVVDDKTIKFYVDGVLNQYAQDTIGNRTIGAGASDFHIGKDSGTATSAITVDEARVSNVARYTSNFTPQTSPFVRDSHTVMLLHFDENGDDPRNTGKVIDDSGNGNNGTLNGTTKYVSGLIGVDNDSASANLTGSQSYAGHQGMFLEPDTTNKITNPSFENSTFNTNWSVDANGSVNQNTFSTYVKFGSNSTRLDNTATAYPENNSKDMDYVANYNVRRLAQGFQVQQATNPTGAMVYLYYRGASGYYFNVEIQPDSSGHPSGTPVSNGSSNCRPFTDLSAYQYQEMNLTFPTPPSLSSSTQYYLVLKSYTNSNCTSEFLGTEGDGIAWTVDSSGTATYPYGDRQYIDYSSVWYTLPNTDYIFSIFKQSTNDYSYTTSINAGDTNSHTLSAYVYNGTFPNQGNTVDSSVASLIYNGVTAPTTYIDTGGGWWRLRYTANGINGAANYGVRAKAGKTIYVDGVQLEEVGNASTFTDGSLGSGYAWTGTPNNSTSTRTIGSLTYNNALSTNDTTGTISMWVKPNWDGSSPPENGDYTRFAYMRVGDNGWGDGPGFVIDSYCDSGCPNANNFQVEKYTGNPSRYVPITVSKGKWYHVVYTWNVNTDMLYVNLANTDAGSFTGSTDTGNVRFGTMANAGSPYATISDVRVYDTPLTTAEVTDLYYSGLVTHSEDMPVDRFVTAKGQNPVAIYHFDEGTGSVAHDSTLYKNDLDITSAPWNMISVGANNLHTTNLNFLDSNSFAKRAWDSDFDFGSDSFSITGWLRWSSTAPPGNRYLLSRYDTAGYKIYMNSSGYLCFGIDGDSTWSPADSACSSATQGSYADSRWHTFSAVKTSNTNISLYVDGTQVGTDTSLTANGSLNSSAALYIGIDSDGVSNGWVGNLDDIAIYPYAKTPAQVKQDTISPQASTLYGASQNDFMTNGLVGYWKLDETSGTSVTDYSGNNYTGTLINAQESNTSLTGSTINTISDTANSQLNNYEDGNSYEGMNLIMSGGSCNVSGDRRIISDYNHITKTITVSINFSAIPNTSNCGYTIDHHISGKFGRGLDFTYNEENQNNFDAVDFGNILNMGTGSFTVSAWVNPDYYAGFTQTIVGKFNCCGSTGFYIGLASGYNHEVSINLTVGTNVYTLTGTSPLPNGIWSHITAVIDRTNISNTAVYVNGLRDPSSSTGSLSSLGNLNNGDNFFIGKHNDYDEFFSAIDDVRVYNRALTANEVSQLYNWAPGPIHYWNFDENTGTIAHDKGSSPVDGTLHDNGTGSGLPLWTNGKVGSALNYDPNGIGMTTVLIGNAGLNGLTAATLEYWYKDSADRTANHADSNVGEENVGAFKTFHLEPYTDGYVYAEVGDGSQYYGGGGFTLNDTAWHHLAMVFDGSQFGNNSLALKAYVDGIQQTINFADDGNHLVPSSIHTDDTNFQIPGKEGSSIDEVKIYNYPRTQKQIIEDMNAGHPAPGSPVGSPVGWWKFDEGFGTRLNNSGNGSAALNGIIGGTSAPAWTNNGKYNKALSFGGDDYVRLGYGNPSNLQITGPMTISAWINPTSVSATQEIISKYNGNYKGFKFLITNNAYLQVWLCTNNPSNSCDTITTTQVITPGNWQHVVFTTDGISNVSLYINGVLAKQGSGLTIVDSGSSAGIGYATWYGAEFFNGLIDDFKIYNIELTADQVKEDFNQGKATSFGATSTDSSGTPSWSASGAYCVPGSTDACNPPVGEWKFDEKQGQTANDTSGNGYTGTLGANALVGTDDPTWTRGKNGSSLYFDGSDYINFGDILDQAGDYTLETWFKSTGTLSNRYTFMQKGNVSGRIEYSFRLNDSDGHIYFIVFNNGDTPYVWCNGTQVLTGDNQWHHVAAVLTGSTCKLYVDGKFDTSSSTTSGARVTDTTDILNFGRSAGGVAYFLGYLDNMKIYNYARTASQIAWEYNQGDPTLWYKFDDCTGLIVKNSAVNGNGDPTGIDATIHPGGSRTPGTCGSGVSTEMWNVGTSGKYGSSLDLDGSSDYLDTIGTALIASAGQTYPAVSWGGWVNASKSNVQTPIFSKSNEFRLMSGNSAEPWCATGSYSNNTTGTMAIPQGSWMHIMCVYDGISMKLYINGVLNASTQTMDNPTSSSVNTIQIGRLSPGPGRFGGKVDDFRIYNYALTPTQVKSVYNQNSAVQFGQ